MLVLGYPRISPCSVHITQPFVLTAIWEDAARKDTQLYMHQVCEGPMNILGADKSIRGVLSPEPGYLKVYSGKKVSSDCHPGVILAATML